MHICFLCDEYPPGQHGGIGSFTQTLGRALAARGHRVTSLGLYSLSEEREEQDAGVRVIRLPINRTKFAGIMVNARRLAKKLRALNRITPVDVLDGPEMSYALLSGQLPAIKVLRMNGGHHFFRTALGARPRFWRGWLEKRSFAHASHLCAVSEYVANTTRGLLGLGQRQIEILPNPVDTNRFYPLPAIREEAGLIVFVGTVCGKKGVRQLVQALPAIVAAVPEARLLVVGRDGRDAATGESFTMQLRAQIPVRLADRIEFTGHIENAALPETLARASVCVYPSHMEAQGIVIVEGMAMGKAVVANATGPGTEVIEDGVSGLLCNPHDPGSIAGKVIALLKNDDLRKQLGQQARQRAVNHFSIDKLVSRNEDFYRRCVERGAEPCSRAAWATQSASPPPQ